MSSSYMGSDAGSDGGDHRRNSSGVFRESHLIGSILADETEDPSPLQSAMKSDGASRIEQLGSFRSSSAPPTVLPLDPNQQADIHPMFAAGEGVNLQDPRLDPAYYLYYYSQRPLDPRLPPPLISHSHFAQWQQEQMYKQFSQDGRLPAGGVGPPPSADFGGSQPLGSLSGDWGPGGQPQQQPQPPQHQQRQGQDPRHPGSGGNRRSSSDDWDRLLPQQGAPQGTDAEEDGDEKPRSVVDWIQQDFPRTPSPIYQTTGLAAPVPPNAASGEQPPLEGGEGGSDPNISALEGLVRDNPAYSQQPQQQQQQFPEMEHLPPNAQEMRGGGVPMHNASAMMDRELGGMMDNLHIGGGGQNDFPGSRLDQQGHHPFDPYSQPQQQQRQGRGMYDNPKKVAPGRGGSAFGGGVPASSAGLDPRFYSPSGGIGGGNPHGGQGGMYHHPQQYGGVGNVPMNPMMAAVMGYGQGGPQEPPFHPQQGMQHNQHPQQQRQQRGMKNSEFGDHHQLYGMRGGDYDDRSRFDVVGNNGRVDFASPPLINRQDDVPRGHPHHGLPPNHHLYPNSIGGRDLISPAIGSQMGGRPNHEQAHNSVLRGLPRFPSGGNTPAVGPMGGVGGHSVISAEGPYSTLLEEFRNNRNKKFELKDILGHVVEFSGDQHGSRFIQQKLETCSDYEKEVVFGEILPTSLRLMTDVFGNYVIQKFFEHGLPEHKQLLAEQLKGHVLPLALQMYGCRVIQKALEVIDEGLQTLLISELDGHVMKCVKDQNGNHVIQKCIEKVDSERIGFIVDAFVGQVAALATHPYGCRVIQRVLEHCGSEQSRILEELLRSANKLVQDQYGNYVVQHVLEHGKESDRAGIISKMKGHILHMSQHKFASNVVEKCFEFAPPESRQQLIGEVLGFDDDAGAYGDIAAAPITHLVKDQYGNYVIQKMVDTSDDDQRKEIVTRVKLLMPSLRKFTYGRHIIARLEKLGYKI